MSGEAWDALRHELDLWQAQGLAARLWLRDDDATQPGPALDHLIALARRWQAPVLLAVIPALATPQLAQRLAGEPLVTPCQHGFAHTNHAGPGEKKSELGPQRPLAQVLEALREGKIRLAALFGARVDPILVPPWNRIAPGAIAALPSLGFTTLSTFGPARPAPPPGLAQLNSDLDIIDWHNGRSCIPPAALNTRLAALLADARGRGGAPVGILTHHRDHDAAAWSYLDALLKCTAFHTSAHWVAARALQATI